MTKQKWKSRTLPAMSTIGPVSLWLICLIAIPLIYVVVMSFCGIDQYYNIKFEFTLANYQRLLNRDYMKIYAQSIMIGLCTTFICILIGYPFAYVIARTKTKRKALLYMLVIIPF